MLEPTPSQTVGPFFWLGLCRRPCSELVAPGTPGALRLAGRVLDGEGAPVPDAMVELWQADATGGHRDGFGWGRCGTDADGAYAFLTLRPGPLRPGEAPRFELLVFARGLLKPLLTRAYLPGEPANEQDPVLAAIDPGERATLVAAADGEGLRFDVHLQGERQTAFFAA